MHNLIEEAKKKKAEYENRNVLNVAVSFYESTNNSKNKKADVNLEKVLQNKIDSGDSQLDEKLQKLIDNVDLEKIRKLPKNEYNVVKKTVPAITISGIFDRECRSKNTLKNHTGLICIDIDKKHQQRDVVDMKEIFEQVKQLKYISYCGKSVGGEGLFAIVPIQDQSKHSIYFDALKKEFADMGIIIDKACKDVSRLRILSYDSEAYFNIKAVTYTQEYETPTPSQTPIKYNNTKQAYAKQDTGNHETKIYDNHDKFDRKKFEDILQDVYDNHIDITKTYDDWLNIGIICYENLGENGRNPFHKLSENYYKYNTKECDKQFNNCAIFIENKRKAKAKAKDNENDKANENDKDKKITMGTLIDLYNKEKERLISIGQYPYKNKIG
jgi:hypothetical protein